jgi:hypothetical protein
MEDEDPLYSPLYDELKLFEFRRTSTPIEQFQNGEIEMSEEFCRQYYKDIPAILTEHIRGLDHLREYNAKYKNSALNFVYIVVVDIIDERIIIKIGMSQVFYERIIELYQLYGVCFIVRLYPFGSKKETRAFEIWAHSLLQEHCLKSQYLPKGQYKEVFDITMDLYINTFNEIERQYTEKYDITLCDKCSLFIEKCNELLAHLKPMRLKCLSGGDDEGITIIEPQIVGPSFRGREPYYGKLVPDFYDNHM